MSIVDNLKGIFSSLAQGSSNTFVGIDIGSAYVKLVQLKKEKGRILLETYGEIALGSYQEGGFAGQITTLENEPLKEALANLIKQANVTASTAIISVSSSTSLIFVLRLPQISERELSGVVKTEARKYIPVPLTEVSLDWWMIPEKETYGEEESRSSKKSEVDVLVAAVRNEVVSRYNDVSRGLNIFKDVRFEIETFSAIRGSFKHELSPVMLLDFGASGTRISVIEHGVVRKFRAVSRGAAYITSILQKNLELPFDEAEKLKRAVGLDRSHSNEQAYKSIETGMAYIFSEMQNVIFDFEKEYRKPITKIILTGGGARLIRLQKEIESRYNITTVYADPFSKALSPDFLNEVLEEAGPEFAVAVGLALQGVQ
jgi:type IV pilus assembly protein PilM